MIAKAIAKKASLPWLWLSAVIILIDQFIKWIVVQHLVYQQSVPVFPFLNISLTFNSGAAYGFLGAADGWQVYLFSAIALIIAVIFIIWLAKLPRYFYVRALGLSLIIGGAMGNLIDRVRLNYVVDYIDFHVRGWHFATFNFADSAICVGAFFLVVSLIFPPKRKS